MLRTPGRVKRDRRGWTRWSAPVDDRDEVGAEGRAGSRQPLQRLIELVEGAQHSPTRDRPEPPA